MALDMQLPLCFKGITCTNNYGAPSVFITLPQSNSLRLLCVEMFCIQSWSGMNTLNNESLSFLPHKNHKFMKQLKH